MISAPQFSLGSFFSHNIPKKNSSNKSILDVSYPSYNSHINPFFVLLLLPYYTTTSTPILNTAPITSPTFTPADPNPKVRVSCTL